LLATGRTIGRDRSADGKDGFRGIVTMDDTFLPLVANPKVLPTLVALLSTNLHLMSSNLIHLPSIPPGSPRTIRIPSRHGWHRDMSAATTDLGHETVPRLSVKAAYFLSDITPDAGITTFLPGSHTPPPPNPHPTGVIDTPGAITPALGPTDVVVFENRTWHAGGLNTSGHPRLAVMMQYGYRWLSPLDDPAPTRGVLAAQRGLPMELSQRSVIARSWASPSIHPTCSFHFGRGPVGSPPPRSADRCQR